MKKTNLKTVQKLFVSFVMLLVISAASFAMPPESAGPMNDDFKKQENKMQKRFDKLAQKLQITDEQKAKMQQLMQSDMAKKKELRQEIKAKKDAVDNELLKEHFDAAVIETLTKDIRQLAGDIAQINIDGKIQIRSILSYEQFKQLEEDRAKITKERETKHKNKDKK